MAFFEIPLNPYPEKFGVTINAKDYLGSTRWSVPLQCWVMALSDSQGVPILLNLPLIPGVDLLGQFEYLGLSAKLIATTDYDPAAAPGYSELGSVGHLYVGV